MGELERVPGKRTRQSCMIYKVRMARCLLSDQGSKRCEFQAFAMDSCNEGCRKISLKYERNRYKCPLWAKDHAIPLDEKVVIVQLRKTVKNDRCGGKWLKMIDYKKWLKNQLPLYRRTMCYERLTFLRELRKCLQLPNGGMMIIWWKWERNKP